MVTLNQLIKTPRKIIKTQKKNILKGKPQRKVVCVKPIIMTPKKPHSAQRKVTLVRILNGGFSTDPREKKFFTCKIPGEGHSLHPHAVLLIRGGRVRDLPGIKFQTIRGCLDHTGVKTRKNGRSKYGTKDLVKWNRLLQQ